MASVSYANFVMMAKVSPTNIFKISIGLIQGFPIAPLLFTLFIDGPSRKIEVSRKDAILSSIKFSFVLHITHLIFFDDVVLFGKGFVEERGTLCC